MHSMLPLGIGSFTKAVPSHPVKVPVPILPLLA